MILNLIYLFCVNSFLQLTVIIVISSANPSISLSSSSSDSVNHLNLNNHNKLDLGSWQRCIKSCVCDMDETKRKRVICESGKLTRIPTNLIDPSTKVINNSNCIYINNQSINHLNLVSLSYNNQIQCYPG